MSNPELSDLKFEKGRWLLPLTIGSGVICLWVAIDLLSNDFAVITGWISLIFRDTLGVAIAKLIGLIAIVSSGACFFLAALGARYKYTLTVSREGITNYILLKPLTIPLSEVSTVRIGRLVADDMVQKILVIKSSRASMALNSLLLDEPLESVKLKINEYLLKQVE